MPADYEDTIVHGAGEPTIKRRYIDGSEFTFKGDRALAMANTPEAAQWRLENPKQALLNSYSPFDSIEESHPYASAVRDFVEKHKREKGLFGAFADRGMIPGAIAGGVVGAGTGALASLLAKLFLGEASAKRWALVGGAIGTLLGGHNGLVRSRMNKAESPITKSAATYMDPRNFILEKLQSATDVGIGEKVRLAAAVRNLNRSDAEKLASMVRAALGFGVGAIIAKFVFGATSAAGTLFGGVLGAIGTGILANSLANADNQPRFNFNFSPLSYRDIL